MKTLIVPIDFSSTSRNAARYAADMAGTIEANILLLHVYQVPVVYMEIPIAVTEVEIRKNAEKELARIKDELILKSAGKYNVDIEMGLGVFFPELRELCDRIKPYAVVMGSQGSTAAERFFFGGHAVYTIKHLSWPVITVPPGAVYSAVKKIGLALDFTRSMHDIPVDEIKTMIQDFNAELHVVNTAKRNEFDADIVFESNVLENMLKPYRPTYHFIEHENTDIGIIDFSEKNQVDLLIVLPRRHRLIDRLVHTSHSKQLVLHSQIPVLALHE